MLSTALQVIAIAFSLAATHLSTPPLSRDPFSTTDRMYEMANPPRSPSIDPEAGGAPPAPPDPLPALRLLGLIEAAGSKRMAAVEIAGADAVHVRVGDRISLPSARDPGRALVVRRIGERDVELVVESTGELVTLR